MARATNVKFLSLASLVLLAACPSSGTRGPSSDPGKPSVDAVDDARLDDAREVIAGDALGSDNPGSDSGTPWFPWKILCRGAQDCPDDYVCDGKGRCVECMSSQCEAGSFCGQHHQCISIDCEGDSDCVPWRCDASGKCVECLTDAECFGNERCVEGRCEVLDPCKKDSDCEAGLRCSPGTGQCVECREPEDCEPGEFCEAERCLPDLCDPGAYLCMDLEGGIICRDDGGGVKADFICEAWETCQDGKCVGEMPVCGGDCGARVCGFDACGRLCGNCAQGEYCDAGVCRFVAEACMVRATPGCPGCACEVAVCGKRPDCCTDAWNQSCAQLCDEVDPVLECPDCASSAGCGIRSCGMEPCGAFCGPCVGGGFCQNGVCLPGKPVDFGRPCTGPGECLSGYCKSSQGAVAVCTAGCKAEEDCPVGWTCGGDWCVPKPGCDGSCIGRNCGSDLCGGSCGECAAGNSCTLSGVCAPAGKGCEPTEAPTCGGCPCQACVCAQRPECCLNAWTLDCATLCLHACEESGQMMSFCGGDVPPCKDKECGLDLDSARMPISCGSCSSGFQCVENRCVCIPDCEGRDCGPDGCGGSCGTEPPVQFDVFCEEGRWSWVPFACFPATSPGPTCAPSMTECMDTACMCSGMPTCCMSEWNLECIAFAQANCGLDCTPRPVETLRLGGRPVGRPAY